MIKSFQHRIYFLAITLILIFWPLDLLLENSTKSFFIYVTPVFLAALSFFSPLFSLLIPVVSPKLGLWPAVFFICLWFFKRQTFYKTLLFFTLAAAVIAWIWPDLYGQSILPTDYESQQKIIRDTQLYDSIILARTFHNKVKIRINHFNDNLFALLDPNNYLFSFHPREPIYENQMLIKFSYISLVVFLVGFINIDKYKYKKYLASLFLSSFISLSVLKVYDGHDFILWLPFSLVAMHGASIINQKRYAITLWILLVSISLIELIRLILT